MKHMKGITPIISIIVLLLITVSLAGAAYVFLTGYQTTLTGKTLQVSNPGACAGGTTASITVTNQGTLPITVVADCTENEATATCGEITVVRTDSGGTFGNAAFSGTTIDPYSAGNIDSLTFTDDGCHTLGNPTDVCGYSFQIAGQTAAVNSQVTCTG